MIITFALGVAARNISNIHFVGGIHYVLQFSRYWLLPDQAHQSYVYEGILFQSRFVSIAEI